MEETEELVDEGNSLRDKMDKSFPWEEWTLIENGDNAKNRAASPRQNVPRNEVSSSELSYSDIDNTSDAEEARESIRVLSEKTLEMCLSESASCHNEESDGVSVISESENEEPIVSDNGSKVILYGTVSYRSEERSQKNNNNNKEVTTCVYLLIACSMVIAIGIGLASRSYFQNKISNDADYMTIKMENDRLLERMKEFTNVKGILEEIKSSIIQERNFDSADIQNQQNVYLNEHMKRLDSLIDKPKITLTERLQFFLPTICFLLENIRQTDNIVSRRSLCDTSSLFVELSNLRTVMKSVNEEIDDSTRSSNQRFIANVDVQITSMNNRLVNDLTRALDKLNIKNRRKMEKIVYKMRERLCVLRNTLTSENKIRQSLEMNDTFVENCDKIARKKFDSREMDKKQTPKMPQPPISEKKNLKITRPYPPERSSAKEENSTKLYKRPNVYRQNIWETRKCYGDNLSNFVLETQENSDETCSLLVAPPRSSTQKSTKHQTFSRLSVPMEEPKNDEAFGRKKIAKKRSDKLRLKGDGVTSKYSKKNTEDERKNRKRNFSLDEKNNGYRKRTMPTKESSRSSPIESSNINSDFDYKRVYPVKPTLQDRAKKRFGKARTNVLDRSEREENIQDNGQWQFARSQIRDQLRKDESIDNWYFDRVSNRKTSRMNINDNIENHR